MKRLGITGGIGSGKSYVCRLLGEQFGIPVYNCDIRARILTCTDIDIILPLTELIPCVYDAGGELDKARLTAFTFASEENLRRVNAIIHPAVRADLHAWYARHAGSPLVGMESAILYESGFQTETDVVLFVDAPLDLRLRRAMERDGVSRDQVEARMARQDTEAARNRADYVLQNDGCSELASQLRVILAEIGNS